MKICYLFLTIFLLCFTVSPSANAIPSFAHQTGQSCIACHAGGQFPELTPYGRLFKLTGYTMGESVNPLSAMAVGSWTKTQNNKDSTGAELSPKDAQAIIDYVSVFAGGKIANNVGLFSQFTYLANDPTTGLGHFGSDNFDLRYADREVSDNRDIIWGVTVNNNPTIQDVWNSSPAWGYPYASTTQGNFGGLPASTLLEGALAQQVAGVGAYAFFNQHYYIELTGYQTARGLFSVLSVGNKKGDPNYPLTYTRGIAPYLRLAYSRELGAHNIMMGVFGMDEKQLPLDASNQPISGQGAVHYRDAGFDSQYQYLMDTHTVTAQLRFIHETISDGTSTNSSGYTGEANLNSLRLKLSYIYQSKYGASFSYSNILGSHDAFYAGGNIAAPTPVTGSANASPNSTMWTPEIFCLLAQNIRIGLQYNYFTQYLGENKNYDGSGRNATGNNTTYAYLWAAF